MIKNIFCWRLLRPLTKKEQDPEPDPEPDPNPIVRGTDPRIRICTNMFRIWNTGRKSEKKGKAELRYIKRLAV